MCMLGCLPLRAGPQAVIHWHAHLYGLARLLVYLWSLCLDTDLNQEMITALIHAGHRSHKPRSCRKLGGNFSISIKAVYFNMSHSPVSASLLLKRGFCNFGNYVFTAHHWFTRDVTFWLEWWVWQKKIVFPKKGSLGKRFRRPPYLSLSKKNPPSIKKLYIL